MSFMTPGERLTQPTVQGIIERGAFIHGVLAFEWYLSLERWLPFFQPQGYKSLIVKLSALIPNFCQSTRVAAYAGKNLLALEPGVTLAIIVKYSK